MIHLARLGAWTVIGLHLLFTVFVFFGGLTVYLWPQMLPLHLGSVVYAIVIMGLNLPCPLTLLEKFLLRVGRLPVYEGDFLPRYVWRPLGLTGDEAVIPIGFIASLLITSAWPYTEVIRTYGI